VSKEIKITRSFSAKVNLGNYENVDISCTAEAITAEEDSFSTSAMLHNFCRNEVREEVDAIKRRKGGANA
jgi:hypothetical protein